MRSPPKRRSPPPPRKGNPGREEEKPEMDKWGDPIKRVDVDDFSIATKEHGGGGGKNKPKKRR